MMVLDPRLSMTNVNDTQGAQSEIIQRSVSSTRMLRSVFPPTHSWTAKSSSGSPRASEAGSPLEGRFKDSAPAGTERRLFTGRCIYTKQQMGRVTYTRQFKGLIFPRVNVVMKECFVFVFHGIKVYFTKE